jgi:hypothetical protein
VSVEHLNGANDNDSSKLNLFRYAINAEIFRAIIESVINKAINLKKKSPRATEAVSLKARLRMLNKSGLIRLKYVASRASASETSLSLFAVILIGLSQTGNIVCPRSAIEKWLA